MHWTLDLAAFFLRTRMLGQRLPLLASFKLTYRCNLACRACPFHRRAGDPDGHMSWDTAVRCLHGLARSGCRLIVFEGGEPLLWRAGGRRAADLMELAKKLFLRVGVTTNGTLGLDLPAHVVWVSIDGLPETHDRLRSGSFDRIRRNLMQARHGKILIHHTINRENRHELKGLLDLLADIPSVRGLTLQLFYPYGQGEDQLGLTESERREAIETAIALKRQGYPILNSTGRLRAMIGNTWACRDDILVNVDPDGTITQGCYAKSRGAVRCRHCGFTPVAEAAGALELRPGSIIAGWRTFISP
ncbi:MAG: radical SAM protein [Deltaproteobacteria bacterium]|nr:radical SAM protein [Deltaproteobacteria bacterium]